MHDPHQDWKERHGQGDVPNEVFHWKHGLLPETPPDVALNQALEKEDRLDEATIQAMQRQINRMLDDETKDESKETDALLRDLLLQRPAIMARIQSSPPLAGATAKPTGGRVHVSKTYEPVVRPVVPLYAEWLALADSVSS